MKKSENQDEEYQPILLSDDFCKFEKIYALRKNEIIWK